MSMRAEELAQRGDFGRAELVGGELIMMSPTKRKHGKTSARIARLLDEFVERGNLGDVTGAETGFLVARDPDTVRAPDAAFVRLDRVPLEDEPDFFYPFAPDLAVEVVSPSDSWTELEQKVRMWLDAGCRLVWVLDPRSKTVHVYAPGGTCRVLSDPEVLDGLDVLPGFTVHIGRLFP